MDLKQKQKTMEYVEFNTCITTSLDTLCSPRGLGSAVGDYIDLELTRYLSGGIRGQDKGAVWNRKSSGHRAVIVASI